ncbi:DUF5956 family protein [Microbacterium deminutum]|uniref:Uncharacterized protein n=1 Tax=Microbacterium deminutum TaxID=344164 RepID=A0ABP5CX07_9MICO
MPPKVRVSRQRLAAADWWLISDAVSSDLVRIVPNTTDVEVVNEITAQDGTTRVVRRLMTDQRDELRELDIQYLADAGIPELPAGFGLYLTLPTHVNSTDELCEAAWAGLGPGRPGCRAPA